MRTEFYELVGLLNSNVILDINIVNAINKLEAKIIEVEKRMEDLFDNPELLPLEVQAILDKYSEMDNTYENCSNLVEELEEVGYTCEFGLDATPYDLQKL